MTVPELNTFSIVARCERRGELGVAVSSAVPAVGSMCPYLLPRVGAVSTQSWVNPYLASAALDAMQSGSSAQDALERALAHDADAASRQVGAIGREGPGVASTGFLLHVKQGTEDWQGGRRGGHGELFFCGGLSLSPRVENIACLWLTHRAAGRAKNIA